MTRLLGRLPCVCEVCGSPHEPTFDAWRTWINQRPDLDSQDYCLDMFDVDLVVVRYGTRRDRFGVDRSVQYVQLIEWKTHGTPVSTARLQVLRVLDDVFRTSFPTARERGRFAAGHSRNWRRIGRSQVLLYGLHVLQLSGTHPENSEWMRWSSPGQPGRLITLEQLIGLLRFDLHPDSLKPLDHRQHKRRVEQLRLVAAS
jgi:hypothetical protein